MTCYMIGGQGPTTIINYTITPVVDITIQKINVLYLENVKNTIEKQLKVRIPKSKSCKFKNKLKG